MNKIQNKYIVGAVASLGDGGGGPLRVTPYKG